MKKNDIKKYSILLSESVRITGKSINHCLRSLVLSGDIPESFMFHMDKGEIQARINSFAISSRY